MKVQDNPLIPNPHPHLLNSIIKKLIIVPSSYQHKKTHKNRKAIRTIEISQSSGPINLVADETIYKEWEDRMERATTTTSSLDAEQDSGNINKTQSMATLNKYFPQGTDSALVDKKKVIIIETSIRSYLHLEEADGTDCLPTTTIFEELARMGYEKPSQKLRFYKAFFSPQWKFLIHTILQCLSAKSTSWNEFSSTMAFVIICLATNQKFNLSKYILDAMVKHLEGGVKFLMYPQFVQVFINQQLGDMSHHKKIYVNPSCTKKIFANMKREGKDFSGRVTPLRKQKKNTKVPHPSDSTADVPNEEHVPTHSNDPLQSGEDRMKLTELMDMCTNLSERFLDLEHTKTAQAQEITNLKLIVKQLEKKAGFRTHNFDRLYKVGVTRRVESSDDESLGAQEDASKQGRSRIEAIDRDVEVTLVETQRRNDENNHNLMFNTSVFDGDEIVVETEEPVINVATTIKSIPSAKPKEKCLVQESGENVSTATTMVSTATTTVVATPAITTPPQQRAKGIAFREPVESTVTTTFPS
ncbi:hypothetical protein Tco_0773457 [Tanacetum coccineum]|uniref:Synaptobrevin, longin-like domain protein n=1 Tax=Tanacetum coccineum TaxID=301880 RepID=A0ABQ4ZN18_9ASTR